MNRQSYIEYITNKYGKNTYISSNKYQSSSIDIEILNEDIQFL